MLINRNITVNGHRTSVRLEPEFWTGLAQIAEREHLTIDQLCSEIDRGAGDLSRTAAIRVFIASYMVRRTEQSAEPLPFAAVAGDQNKPRPIDEYSLVAQRLRAAG